MAKTTYRIPPPSNIKHDKKEFIINYLTDMKSDYKDSLNKDSLYLDIDKLITEIQKEQINKDLCWKIKDEMGKKINIINK